MTVAVSVVVTCYNLSAYISDAIRSVAEQTFDLPIEIIVVDDCSTDGSDAIIRACPEVRYVRTAANGGVLLAMLQGVEAASGEIIAFLDGDDLWEPTKLALVYAAFASNSATAFVTHDLCYIDGEGRPLPRQSRPAAAFAGLGGQSIDKWLRDGILMLGDQVWLGSAFAVHRSRADLMAFAAFARSLPDPQNTYQDWPLAYWIAAQSGLRLDYVPAKLFRYRIHGYNHSGDASTSAKAVRNFKRALNTVEAEVAIGAHFPIPAAARRRAAQQRDYYRFLVDLYSGSSPGLRRWWHATAFVRRQPRLVVKEALRYLGIRTVGPHNFARIAKK